MNENKSACQVQSQNFGIIVNLSTNSIFLEIFRFPMYSNSKYCGEAQKIMPNLVSALKVYATSIYCAFLQGKIATILWKVELRLRKPKETPSLNRVLMFTWSKFFRKNYDNCDWHCDNCGWSDYDNCGWHCDNCGFLRQLWLVLRQLWLIATIVNIATIVITSSLNTFLTHILEDLTHLRWRCNDFSEKI